MALTNHGHAEGQLDYREVIEAADRLLMIAKSAVAKKVEAAGGMDQAQHVAHGFAWLATTIEAMRQLDAWAQRLSSGARFGEIEQLILGICGSQQAHNVPVTRAVFEAESRLSATMRIGRPRR